VRFTLTDAITIGSLQLDVDYSDACGWFAGQADDVECTRLSGLLGALSVFNNEGAQRLLRMGTIDLDGFAAPADLFECRFNSAAPLVSASEFRVSIVAATTIDFVPIEPQPTIAVSVLPVD
jgi:hypothetical protein